MSKDLVLLTFATSALTSWLLLSCTLNPACVNNVLTVSANVTRAGAL